MAKKALVRIDEGDTAVSVAYSCATLLDAGLAEQLGPASAEDEGLEGGGQLAVRAARRLQALKHNLELCQEALARVRDELRPWRRRRERATAELYDLAKDLRKFCRAVFADGEGDAFLGLHGNLPREPKELYAAFSSVARRLADAEWPLPENRLQGFEIKRDKMVRSVIKRHSDLGEALATIKEGETREAVAQAAKNRAADAHSVYLAKCSRFLEATLELAGLPDLAATVRPGVKRRGRPAKKELAAAGGGLPAANKVLTAAVGRERGQLPAPEGSDSRVSEPSGKAR